MLRANAISQIALSIRFTLRLKKTLITIEKIAKIKRKLNLKFVYIVSDLPIILATYA